MRLTALDADAGHERMPGSRDAGAELDPGATVAAAAIPGSPAGSPPDVAPGSTPNSTPGSTPGIGSQPRKKTLAAAIRPRNSDEHRAIPVYHPDSDELPGDFAADSRPSTPLVHGAAPWAQGIPDEIPDETEGADGADDWSVVDQPTVLLAQQMLAASLSGADGRDAMRAPGPDVPRMQRGPVTNERATWAPLPEADRAQQASQQPAAQRADSQPLGAPRQPRPTRPIDPDALANPLYAPPTGKPVTAPSGAPFVTAPEMLVGRFQQVRAARKAHELGQRAPQDPPRVSELVRGWWNDLLPGLRGGLAAQHEARASGAYPAPEYLATAVSWLGDVFGRVSVSTRDLANRAQQNAAPALKRWHQRAEQYAQNLIERLEGSPIQQQAPFLAPGRIAVLFRSGVSRADAQRLLLTAQARPMRAITNKRGFLALVRPGREEEIAERLRMHPYVRDVIYMRYSQDDDPSRSLSVEVPALAAMRG